MKNQKTKLPESFRPLLWSYRFSDIDPDKDKQIIIINTINYGNWPEWQWVFNYYGTSEVKKIIEDTPASAFRQPALKLVCLLLKIKKMKYASRSDYLRAKKDF